MSMQPKDFYLSPALFAYNNKMLIPISNLMLAFLIFSCFIFLQHFLRRFRCFNQNSGHGPPTYPFLGCLIPFCKNRHRLLDWYSELLAESPTQTIVVDRLGARRTIITANPGNVEYILKTKFHNFPKGKAFTDVLGDLLGRGIFNVDGELWHRQRKLVSHEFTTKSLREFVVKTLETEANERLLPLLESVCIDNRVVDLQEVLRRFTFDAICKVSLGEDPGYLEPSMPVSELARSFDMASEISARRGAAPVYAVWKVKKKLRIGSEKRLREAIERVHGEIMELIRSKKLRNEQERKGNEEEDSQDLLSRLISGGHDEEVIRDMVISFIMAGKDTTSAALTWLFWLLSEHPKIEHEILKEVVKTSTVESLDYGNLREMKMLKACLYESMRLYPPVAWNSKHAVALDTLPDGTCVEAGNRVTYFPYGMGRMETIWGKDWFQFKPQRWLESIEEGIVKVSPYKFPVFHAGPRVCLGKEMAFIQMAFVAALILRRFEFRPKSRDRPVFVPLLTAHMAGGFEVMVQKRNLELSHN